MGALTNIFRQVTVTNTAVLVAAGNFNLVGWNLINHDATRAFLKLCNAVTAGAVTIGTTPVVKTLEIPASGTVFLSNDGNLQAAFQNGIVIYVVTGLLDNSTAAPTTGCCVELSYLPNQ